MNPNSAYLKFTNLITIIIELLQYSIISLKYYYLWRHFRSTKISFLLEPHDRFKNFTSVIASWKRFKYQGHLILLNTFFDVPCYINMRIFFQKKPNTLYNIKYATLGNTKPNWNSKIENWEFNVSNYVELGLKLIIF